MDNFRFCPELLEYRYDVIQALDENGFHMLSHYAAVDVSHEDYGLDVCGIVEKEDAEAIYKILQAMFPEWRYGGVLEKDWGLDQGWLARLTREEEKVDSGLPTPARPVIPKATTIARVLVTLSDPEELKRCCQFLADRGHEALAGGTSDSAIQKLRGARPEIVVTSLVNPPLGAAEVIRCAHALPSRPAVLVQVRSVALAVEALALGADGVLLRRYFHFEDELIAAIDHLMTKPQRGLAQAVSISGQASEGYAGGDLLDAVIQVLCKHKGTWTELHTAAVWGYAENAAAIVAQGVPVDALAPLGRTPLIYAAQNNQLEVARLLLQRGAKLPLTDAFGRAALHEAARYGHLEMVKLLVQAGANINADCSAGLTAMDYAFAEYRPELVSALTRLGALRRDNANRSLETSDGRRARVLVVDDDFAMTSVLSEVLRTWGYEVAIGGASDTALEVLPKYKPDLVTTDIENPPLGGWAVVEAVNKLNPAIPVVVLAGCDGLSVPSGVRVTSFLPKPFKSAQLKRVIECALKGIGNLEGKPSKQP